MELEKVIKLVTAGGPDAVIAILVILIALGIFLIRNLVKIIQKKEEQIQKKDERNEKMLENYYDGNKKVTDALNAVYIALVEIKSKL